MSQRFLIVLAIVGLWSWSPALAAQGDIWTLQDIIINTHGNDEQPLNPSVTIIDKHLGVNDGFIEFNLSGDDVFPSCPGGSEQVKFSWKFMKDVSQLMEGLDLNLGVHGELLHMAAPCGGAIAAAARITAIGSKGASQGVSDDQMKITDQDRFETGPGTIDTRFAFGNDYGGARTSTTRIIRLNAYDHNPKLPYAYFMILIGIRGAGPDLLVTYLYKSGTDTPFKPPVDPPVQPPVVTDGNACGFTLGSGILAKWQEFGGEGGVLGCAASNEQEAGRSPLGTTGRYTLFKGGVIIWHRDGPFAGRSFEVHGCIATLYQSMGGTNSWLGFPVSDEHDVPDGRRSNFEGGYILWNAATGGCTPYRDGSASFTTEASTDRPGLDYKNFDLQQDSAEICRDACAAENMCIAYTYVKPGVQGAPAHCWLKSRVPAPYVSDCCTSGVRR